MSFFNWVFQNPRPDTSENCPWDNIPLKIEREAPITSTHACPKCSYFTIKFKAIPEVRLLKEIKEVEHEEKSKKKTEETVETEIKQIEEFPTHELLEFLGGDRPLKKSPRIRPKKISGERFKRLFKKKSGKQEEAGVKQIEEFPTQFFEEKPLKRSVPKPPKLKLKGKPPVQENVELEQMPEPEETRTTEIIEPTEEKTEIKAEEVEFPKKEMEPPKVEIRPKKIKETAKTYRIPESALKNAFTRIVEIERRIPERVSNVSQVEELKQMMGQIERNVRQEKINVVPEIIEKLVETKERIERLRLPEQLDPATETKNKIRELEMKREQINDAKEVVKARYYKGELDENALKSIMENYEQELIRTEVEIKQYKKLLKDLEKKKPEISKSSQFSPTTAGQSIPSATETQKISMPSTSGIISQSVQQPPQQLQTIEVRPSIVRSPETMSIRPIRLPYMEEDHRPPRKRTSIIPKLPEIELKKNEERMVETNLDKILHMVEEEGSVNIGDIAKVLGVKEGQVEEWGKILEDHNLIKLIFPPLGKPVLRKIK